MHLPTRQRAHVYRRERFKRASAAPLRLPPAFPRLEHATRSRLYLKTHTWAVRTPTWKARGAPPPPPEETKSLPLPETQLIPHLHNPFVITRLIFT